jgi:tetratricopeptide (TPR) repeat protein
MALVYWTVLAVYVVGFGAMMVRLWYYRIALLKQVVPGRDPFDRHGDFFFDTTRFTPAGKEIHRKTMRFLWKLLLVAVSGPILLGILSVNPGGNEQDVAACIKLVPADATIAGCTRLLSSNNQGSHNRAVAYSNRGLAYLKTGRTAEAVKDFTSALSVETDYSLALANRCRAYNILGQYDEAIQDCSDAIRIAPNLVSAFEARCLVYSNQGKRDKAIQDCSVALKLGPNNPTAYMTRGAILIDDEKADAALADFEEALSKVPKSTTALIGHGVALGMLGRHDEAIRDFNQALILDPGYWGGYASRCDEYNRNGDFDKALNDCNKAMALGNNDPNILDTRGFVYLKSGNIAAANQDFNTVIQKQPTVASSFYGRALIERLRGNEDAASADIAKAKALKSNIEIDIARYHLGL